MEIDTTNPTDSQKPAPRKRMSMISPTSAGMSFLDVQDNTLSHETLKELNMLIDSFQKPPEEVTESISPEKKSAKESSGWGDTLKGFSGWAFK